MAPITRRVPAIAIFASLVSIACAQAVNAGEEGQDGIGSGGEVGGGDCRPETGCSTCTGCIAACICSTGDKVGCVETCGAPNGGPPPPPPAGGGGSGAVPGGGGSPPGGGGPSNAGSPNAGGSSAGGSGGTPTGGCTYPPGPYGTTVGKVVDPSLSWQGYLLGAATPSTIGIKDYFDCDGTRGIHALLVSEAALWCGACQTEAADLDSQLSGGWTALGIEVLVLVMEDKSGNPAQLKHAEIWKNTFNAQGWSCAADPAFTFKGSGLPVGAIIDPRTMKVVAKTSGYDPTDPTLEQLAQKNKK